MYQGCIRSRRLGRPVTPRNVDHTLRLRIEQSGVPRLSSHGLRHTAATHMVRTAQDVGELRAAADVLGHNPDMLMRTYAHTVPETSRSLTEEVTLRGG